MDVLYFAFANDPDRPLDELKREDEAINHLLEPLAARGHFQLVWDSFATLDKVAAKLSLYKNDLVLFHFSGHAGPDQLLLEGERARALGIAELLGDCLRLQLVVLNGCATEGQVALLHERNIPLAIATHRPVKDRKAAAFAIQFYQSLAWADDVNGAFGAARGKVLAMDAGLDIARGPALRSESPEAPSWGLSWAPGREDAAAWRLPTGAIPVPVDYVPNAFLLDALLKALAPYSKEVAQIVADEVNGGERSVLDKREAVLKALPHPISEPVRFLLAPEAAGSKLTFFDRPGPQRLKQMVAVFDTVTQLMGFIVLAQLWDDLNGKIPPAIPAETRVAIGSLLAAGPAERQRLDFIALARAFQPALGPAQPGYFIEELKKVMDGYEEGKPFYDACRFFADIKFRLATLGQAATAVSITAEEKLATVLAELGFVARYTIASVKNIYLLKNRSNLDPSYRHSIVKLIQRFVGLETVPEVRFKPYDNSSVLLLGNSPNTENTYLSLTPFVIDENAFDDKATVAKLHYFERYVPEQDAYVYRHIYMPDDPPLLVAQQKNFNGLKAQFDAFAQLLFHQPMRDALP